ncbi:Uncharacterised protein [Streptococcus pyogenes]|uniref:hypothetical protein n=1 Tax=Streptococcus pyogenes TaxID=1314 RepID=UPI00109D629A|nr:hypothetical protein [Streptococcus pyogenes]VGX80232.1 Uncharacterised protein [Streptococcus pyogenes]VGX80344.1 Uncharacterised protein [Streptococcus pyogenes]VHH54868.1 Uncharacterised protein [Streptococcus pyogenes]VHI22031.1 Uncharacterised protein [Streptococcus pyogenes]
MKNNKVQKFVITIFPALLGVALIANPVKADDKPWWHDGVQGMCGNSLEGYYNCNNDSHKTQSSESSEQGSRGSGTDESSEQGSRGSGTDESSEQGSRESEADESSNSNLMDTIIGFVVYFLSIWI